MTKTTPRYERPSIEVEFDLQALTREDCCRPVFVVFRICGIPEQAMLTVTIQRVYMPGANGKLSQDYEEHPYAEHLRVRDITVKGYREYAGLFLARPHATETGTLCLKLESQSYTVLAEASFRLDSREAKPVYTLSKGHLKDIRFLPQFRSQEERNALGGQYPPDVLRGIPAKAESGARGQSRTASMIPLFSLED